MEIKCWQNIIKISMIYSPEIAWLITSEMAKYKEHVTIFEEIVQFSVSKRVVLDVQDNYSDL